MSNFSFLSKTRRGGGGFKNSQIKKKYCRFMNFLDNRLNDGSV